MKLFLRYLKTKIRTIAVSLFFAVFFAVSFILYRLPVQAVLYPTALCILFGIIFLAVDFIRIQKKHKALVKIQTLMAEMIERLPSADSITESDYQQIISNLRSDIIERKTESEQKYCDMIEYYTVWAHQIKTPIAAMKLSLQQEDTPLARRLSADLFRIEQYVEMVLVFLRLDSYSSDYVFLEHKLDCIIRGAVKKFASEFIGKQIRFEYETIDKKVVTDAKWLSFVLEQLISNALKYTHSGSISIYMQTPDVLCIKDTGIGIAPEDLPRIFEKGYTGYNGRRDKSASGIGLYLCKRICRNLGIGITAKSVLGEGTEILLDFSQYDLKKE